MGLVKEYLTSSLLVHCLEFKIRNTLNFDHVANKKVSFLSNVSSFVVKCGHLVLYILEPMGNFKFISCFFSIVRFVVVSIPSLFLSFKPELTAGGVISLQSITIYNSVFNHRASKEHLAVRSFLSKRVP